MPLQGQGSVYSSSAASSLDVELDPNRAEADLLKKVKAQNFFYQRHQKQSENPDNGDSGNNIVVIDNQEEAQPLQFKRRVISKKSIKFAPSPNRASPDPVMPPKKNSKCLKIEEAK